MFYNNENKLHIICYDCEEENIIIDNSLENNVKIEVYHLSDITEIDLSRNDDFKNNLHIYFTLKWFLRTYYNWSNTVNTLVNILEISLMHLI